MAEVKSLAGGREPGAADSSRPPFVLERQASPMAATVPTPRCRTHLRDELSGGLDSALPGGHKVGHDSLALARPWRLPAGGPRGGVGDARAFHDHHHPGQPCQRVARGMARRGVCARGRLFFTVVLRCLRHAKSAAGDRRDPRPPCTRTCSRVAAASAGGPFPTHQLNGQQVLSAGGLEMSWWVPLGPCSITASRRGTAALPAGICSRRCPGMSRPLSLLCIVCGRIVGRS